MSITIRPLNLPEDYASIAPLLSIATQSPVTVEELMAQDDKTPASNRTGFDDNHRLTGFCRERVVGVDEHGNVVGYAASWRAPWAPSGQLASHLAVHPEMHGRGIGGALLQHIETWARDMGAHVLMSEVPDTMPKSLTFVENRGYTIDRHLFTSSIQLENVHSIDGMSIRRQLEGQGLRVLDGDEAVQTFGHEAMYRLYVETEQDIPGQLGSTQYHEWLEAVEETPSHYILVTAKGDLLVGVTHCIPIKGTTGLYNEYTCVRREYRGHGIAKALKLLSMDTAKQHGITFMNTDNDSENHGMLAVNRKLGYVEISGGHYRVIKNLK